MNLATLTQLAQAATPAPWTIAPTSIPNELLLQIGTQVSFGSRSIQLSIQDAAFIAACDPQTILALVARCRRLICPHGDTTCPCRDGELCHYERGNFTMSPMEALVARVRELTLALQTAKAHMVNYRQDCTTCAVVDRALTPSEPRDA